MAFTDPRLRAVARRASDWVDLQGSLLADEMRAVAPHASGRLLDVGCGDRPFEDTFRPHVTAYVGLEHEATFRATANADRRAPDVLYDGTRIPFDDASFDTVLSVQVLEHTPQPRALVAEMVRVLRPGGTLLVSAPFSFRLHEEPHDYFRYSPHGLRVLLAEADCEVLAVRSQGGLFAVLGHKVGTFLAFRVARLGGTAQSLGKLGFEPTSRNAPRWWTLPLVAPVLAATAAGARLLDRLAPDPTEALGFTVIARKR